MAAGKSKRSKGARSRRTGESVAPERSSASVERAPGSEEGGEGPRGARRVLERLFEPVDAASLVFFRVAYGLIMAWHCLDYLADTRIVRWYTAPPVRFHYAGFSWIEPLSQSQFELFFVSMAALAVAMAAGLFFRWAAGLFFVGYLYVFLLDAARYNNHEYLICLLNLLMVFLPVGAAGSMLKRNPAATAPAWALWLVQFQVGVPYFFGGLAKLNYDWMVRGEPIGLWLRENKAEGSLDLSFFREAWSGHLFAWGGTVFDLLIVPALLWRRTRLWAYLAATAFHLTNSQLFVIGIFPWMMIALSTIYFEADWPKRLGLWGRGAKQSAKKGSKPQDGGPARVRPWVAAALAAWVLVQVTVPFRHLLIPGHVDWTEEGHRYAWRMKLRHKEGEIRFLVKDVSTGQTTVYQNFEGVLSTVQERMMLHDPEMIRQFVHRLSVQLSDMGQSDVEIRAVTNISLNGRKPAPMIDPEVDLAATPASFWGGARWIQPLDRQASLPDR